MKERMTRFEQLLVWARSYGKTAQIKKNDGAYIVSVDGVLLHDSVDPLNLQGKEVNLVVGKGTTLNEAAEDYFTAMIEDVTLHVQQYSSTGELLKETLLKGDFEAYPILSAEYDDSQVEEIPDFLDLLLNTDFEVFGVNLSVTIAGINGKYKLYLDSCSEEGFGAVSSNIYSYDASLEKAAELLYEQIVHKSLKAEKPVKAPYFVVTDRKTEKGGLELVPGANA